jgi:hypothetical protein
MVLIENCAPLPDCCYDGGLAHVEKETVFDFYICEKTLEWKLWQTERWDPPKKIAFS